MLFARVQHQYRQNGGIRTYQTYPTILSLPIYIYTYIHTYAHTYKLNKSKIHFPYLLIRRKYKIK